MMRLFDAAAVVAAILVIWLGLYAYAGEAAIAPPLRTFAFAVELFSRASFWNHVGATMTAFAMAFTVSAVVGIALGLLLGLRRGRRGGPNPQLALHHSQSHVVSNHAVNLRTRHVS